MAHRAPIYIIGRQHCGNTMLATMLGHHPELYAFTGEGNFFEHVESIRSEPPKSQIRRIAHEIARGDDPALEAHMKDAIVSHLRDEGGENAFEQYARGKAVVAAKHHASRWVQKATSYIFQVEPILQAFPESRFLFLVRNPLDLAASVQRREYYQHHLGRTIWGWNKGVRKALKWTRTCPDSLRIYRYEDLVEDTDSVIREISDFCGIKFDPKCTKVRHVNPSEHPHAQTGEEGSPDQSRVHYYPDVLSTADEMAVRALVSTSTVQSLYPDLPSCSQEPVLRHKVRACRFLLASLGASVREHAKMLADAPAHTIRRLRKRLFG